MLQLENPHCGRHEIRVTVLSETEGGSNRSDMSESQERVCMWQFSSEVMNASSDWGHRSGNVSLNSICEKSCEFLIKTSMLAMERKVMEEL